MRSRALLLAAFLLAATPLLAQVIIDVEVVDVPVFVTRGDKPVAGLTRENFELLVDGKPQPIEYFEEVRVHGDAPALRERRLFVLLFDLAFSSPSSLPRAQRGAGQLILNAGPSDYFAVATYSQRDGVRFAVPFTQDRKALARAIRSLNTSRSGDPLSIVMTPPERAVAGSDPEPFASTNPARDSARAVALRATEDQVLMLADLSERLAPLEGQKHVVVLTQGWNNVALSVYDDLVAMHRRFQEADVFLHTVALPGLGATGGKDSLYALAAGSGGKVIHSRHDMGRALELLSSYVDRGYRLGFRPADLEGGHGSIEVRVRGAGRVRVDHRKGFSPRSERPNPNDGLYLADIVLNDVPQTGTAAALTLRDGTLSAEIPMREIAAQGPRAELLVYAFAADGSALMYHREVIQATEAAAKTFTIAVPQGTAVAKALLRVGSSVGLSRVEAVSGP